MEFTEAVESVASFFVAEEKMVKVNGERLVIAGSTLTEYLLTANYDIKKIAVERNGEIVPKIQYDRTILEDGDSIEIVSFVGGG